MYIENTSFKHFKSPSNAHLDLAVHQFVVFSWSLEKTQQ